MLLRSRKPRTPPPTTPRSPPPRPEPRRDRPAAIYYVVGATGSGKTWYVRQLIARHRGRVLVWDWKDDYPWLPTARTLADFARMAGTHQALRYVPDFHNVEREFELFCRVAWTVQSHDPGTDCLLIVEELAEVTAPNHAPPWWRRINVQGRVLGFTVVGTTQRPAYVDKSFTGNATIVRCGRLAEFMDARTIGQRIGVDPRLLMKLPDRHAYLFNGRETTLHT